MKLCLSKHCYDEYIGILAIGISVIYYIIQFIYIQYLLLNVSSFSVYAIILGIISEALYCFLVVKNSPTIMFTRSMITTIGFSYLLFIWLMINIIKNNKKT